LNVPNDGIFIHRFLISEKTKGHRKTNFKANVVPVSLDLAVAGCDWRWGTGNLGEISGLQDTSCDCSPPI